MDVVARAQNALTLAGLCLALLPACGSNLLSPSSNTTNTSEKTTCANSAVPNRFLVHWKNGKTSVEQSESAAALERDVIKPNLGKIAFSEPDYAIHLHHPVASGSGERALGAVIQPSSLPADDWGQQDVDAASAWALADGTGVIVAVVDSGADITHPQLKNQIAVNAADIPDNGKDDDGNGYVDDTYGYNFEAKSGAVHDGSEGHGTHVSGIILAEHTGTAGSVNGLAPGAKLLPLNFMDDSGSGRISDAMSAIDYAVMRGARVINASWGGADCSSSLQLKISGLEAKGILFVVAAGNGDDYGRGFDIASTGSYPASYGFPGQVTVGAVMQTQVQGQLTEVMASFSNFSTTLVHLMAPGAHIRSTFPLTGSTCGSSTNPAGYCVMDGTSMATPFVSGTAALLFSYRPKATVAQVKAALLAGTNVGSYPSVSHGRLNAKKALDALAQTVAQ